MLELLLYGDIGDPYMGCDASSVKKWLTENPEADILVRINSAGGMLFDGVAIYNMLAEHRAKGHKVDVMIDGQAVSMASEIAMVGETIRIANNAVMMIHNPANVCWGDAEAMRSNADTLMLFQNQAVAIYAGRSGNTPEDVQAMMDAETWMDAATAVEKGFADEVIDPLVLSTEATTMMASRKVKMGPATPINVTKFGFIHPPVNRPDLILVDAPQMSGKRPGNPAPVAPGHDAPKEKKDMTTLAGGADPANLTAEQIAEAAAQAAAAAAADAGEPTMSATQIASLKKRNTSILMWAGKLNVSDELRNDALTDVTMTVEDFLAKAYAAEEDGDDPAQNGSVQPEMRGSFRAGTDLGQTGLERELESRIVSMHSASLVAEGLKKVHEIPENQRQFATMSVVDTAKWCLMNGGAARRDLDRMSKRELLSTAFRMRGMHTTSDLPGFLALGYQRVLGTGYDSMVQNTNFQFWTDEIEVKDWRDVNVVSAGMMSGLRRIPEGGTFEQMTLEEYLSRVKLEKKGGDITVSLETIESDDLGLVSRIPFKLGQRARLDDQKIAELALKRAIRVDGKTGLRSSIFNIGDNTLMPEDHDLNVEALDIITDLLADQMEPLSAEIQEAGEGDDLDYLGYRLKQLLVGRGLRSRAKRLSSENGFVPTEFGANNIYAGTFDVYELSYVDPLDYFGQDLPSISSVVAMVSMTGKKEPEVYPIIVNDGLSARWGVLKRRAGAIINERGIVKGHQEHPVGYSEPTPAPTPTPAP